MKSFFEAHCTIPVDELPYLPCATFSYMSFSMVTATRLLFLSDSDWNHGVARKAMDFVSITRQLSDHFDQADRFAAAEGWRRKNRCHGVDDSRPDMATSRDKLRWVSSWFLSKQGPADESQPRQPGGADVGVMGVDPNGILLPITGLDSERWEAMLGDFDFFQPPT